jgi:hypothetical protein
MKYGQKNIKIWYKCLDCIIWHRLEEKIAGWSENGHVPPASRKSGEFLAFDV